MALPSLSFVPIAELAAVRHDAVQQCKVEKSLPSLWKIFRQVARPVSLPRCYRRPIIDLGTIAGLHERDHQLAAYCRRCDAWRVLPLGECVGQGKGSLRLPIRVRCRVGSHQGRATEAEQRAGTGF